MLATPPSILMAARPDDTADGFVASALRFPGIDQLTASLYSQKPVVWPDPLVFRAYLAVLDDEVADYPSNVQGWPLMSTRMLEVVRGIGRFAHVIRPALLVDDRLETVSYESVGSVPATATRFGYCVVDGLERLDLIDWDRSDYAPDDIAPNEYVAFRRLELKSAPSLPPMFRVVGIDTDVFVSSQCRLALESAGSRGLEFDSPAGIYPSVARPVHLR